MPLSVIVFREWSVESGCAIFFWSAVADYFSLEWTNSYRYDKFVFFKSEFWPFLGFWWLKMASIVSPLRSVYPICEVMRAIFSAGIQWRESQMFSSVASYQKVFPDCFKSYMLGTEKVWLQWAYGRGLKYLLITFSHLELIGNY